MPATGNVVTRPTTLGWYHHRLETPFGWEWREEFTNVRGRMENQGDGNARPRMENVPPKKPSRPVPKL